MSKNYPVTFDVAYPNRSLNRLTTFFRLIVAIPIFIILCAVSGGNSSSDWSHNAVMLFASGGILVAGPLLMILFRQKYPRWWFDWNVELTRFSARVGIYLALMDDRYPSTDSRQSEKLDIAYPDVEKDLNSWLPIVKWLLAIPHYIVLVFLNIAAVIAVIIAWFAILFTGRYPRNIFDFVVGVTRWNLRVLGYAFLLVTDEYPPFRLSE